MTPPVATAGQSLNGILESLGASPWSLVFVSLVENSSANAHLVRLMGAALPGLNVHALPLTDLRNNWFASIVCDHAIQEANVGIRGLTSGYYLFQESDLVGFHPATAESEDLERSAQIGLVTLAVKAFFGSERPLEDALDAGLNHWELKGAQKAAAHFKTIIALLQATTGTRESRRESANRKQRSTVNAEFVAACRLLNVSEQATKAEFKRAYRSAARQAHPDVGGNDAQMKALNAAKELYMGVRGWDNL